MRALVFDQDLNFDPRWPDPQPAPGECVIRVCQAGICSTDLQITRGYMGFRGVLGHEFVGIVEQGSDAWINRRVACEINCVCGRCAMCQGGLGNHCPERTVLGIAVATARSPTVSSPPNATCTPFPIRSATKKPYSSNRWPQPGR
jgi:alcohol dehydrogenase